MTTRQQLTALALNDFRRAPALNRIMLGVSPRGRQFILDLDNPSALIGPTARETKLISAGWLRAQSQLLLYAERRDETIFVAAGDPWGWLRCSVTINEQHQPDVEQENFSPNRCTLPFKLVSPFSIPAEELEALTERWLRIGKTCVQWSSVGIPADGGDESVAA